MFGFLNLHKPQGITSHDCVAKVRKLLKIKRVGHGGTLDPLATGVLPIAIGKATRLLSYLPEAKTYEAKVRFGVQTSTDDLEGEVIATQDASQVTLEEVESFLGEFQGKIEQVPPAYSAIQKGGKRLYELARAGKQVDVPSRTVEVYDLRVLHWQPGDRPEIDVEIHCGPGTYIRAIARDLGQRLQTGGTLAQLKRTLSCGMSLTDSLTLEQLAEKIQQGTFTPVHPKNPLSHLPTVVLTQGTAKRWCNGQQVPISEKDSSTPLAAEELSSPGETPQFIQVYHPEDHLLGIAQLMPDSQLLVPKVVFN